jgi:hypothetical protein
MTPNRQTDFNKQNESKEIEIQIMKFLKQIGKERTFDIAAFEKYSKQLKDNKWKEEDQ